MVRVVMWNEGGEGGRRRLRVELAADGECERAAIREMCQALRRMDVSARKGRGGGAFRARGVGISDGLR